MGPGSASLRSAPGMTVEGMSSARELARRRSMTLGARGAGGGACQCGEHAGLERPARHRLEQKLVHPVTYRIEHARTLAVSRQHDDRHVAICAGSAIRAQPAHKVSAA